MADKIKGITVQIGGDTAPLSKALRNVDKEIRATQSDLKEVNKLLKLDPSNTNLLKEKQKLLADQISKTKDKLEGLKKAQQEAKQMLANGEIGQKEYDELSKQVDKCETQLKELERQSEETKKSMKADAEKIGKAFQDVGSKIEDAGKKLAPFSAAAAAGLGYAVKTTADFDEAMSKVAAISGATGEEFDALRTKAREMGESTKFSATEAAEAFQYMAMAGWKTEDMLDGIEGVLYLAAAAGEDLGITSDIVTDALTAMGYSAKDAGRLADVMAAASSNANTNVSMMGETFKYAASVCGAYGYTMEDLALATGLMANAGIKASQAGTSMRSIMSRLATNAGASSKALGALDILTERLGVAFYDAQGNMRPFRDVINESRAAWKKLTKEEQANYANKIAGKNAMTGWLALMNSAEEDVNKLTDAIDNSTGAAEGMADTMQDNLKGQLTILKSQLQELAISVGDTLMPTIREIVAWVQKMVDNFNKMDDSTKAMIAKIAVIVAALSPLLIIGGKLISGIGSIISFIPKITSFLSGIGGPISLAVAGVTALAGSIISYRKSLDAVREEHAKLTPDQEALTNKVNDQAEAWKGVEEARKNAYSEIQSQTKQENDLWKALQNVVDEQGKVVEGKEDEAKILIDQLNGALGTELEMVDGQIKGYQDLSANIDKVIAKKQAEALLAADQDAWAEAYKNRSGAAMDVAEAEAQVADQTQKIAEQEAKVAKLEKQLEQTRADANDETGAMAATVYKLTKELAAEKNALEGDKENLEELKKTQASAQKTLDSYDATLANHDKLQEAIAKGSTEDMKLAQERLVNSFIDAEHGTKESLERQTKEFLEQYEKQRDIVNKTGSEEARQQSYNMGKLVNDSIAELKKLDPKLAEEMRKEYNTINENGKKWAQSGAANAKKYADSVVNGTSGVKDRLKEKLDLAGPASTWAKDMMEGYAASMKKYSYLPTEAAGGVAKNIEKILGFSEPEEGPLKDFHTYGPDMMKLLAEGINDSAWMVMQAAQGVAGNLKASLEGTKLTATLDQKSIPLGSGVTLNITNFNNYSDADIRELTNEIMETAAQFAQRKGAAFA